MEPPSLEEPAKPRALPVSTLGFAPLRPSKPRVIACPWPTLEQMHVRSEIMLPQDSHTDQKESKKKSVPRVYDISPNENVVSQRLRPDYFTATPNEDYPIPNIRIPARQTFKKSDVIQYARNEMKGHLKEDTLVPLLNRLEDLSAWDRNEYEVETWACKYAPTSGKTVMTDGKVGESVTEWLVKRFEQLKTANKSTHKSLLKAYRKKPLGDDLDGFIDDTSVESDNAPTEEKENQNSFLILHGPSGSGKSSAVYAAATELGAYVMELNPSDKRSSKKLLEKLGGMGKSHLVHRSGINSPDFQQKSIVLLDEVDILFDEDQTFWTGLDKFVETSRRPVIMTCRDPGLLPPNVIENHVESFVRFDHGSFENQKNALWLIALCEGHILDKFDLGGMIEKNKGDFRASLNELQFWCQMALGDRRSGINWMLTDKERKDYHLEDVRIMSDGTHIGGQERLSPEKEITLESWTKLVDALSDADYIRANIHTQFELSLEEEYLKDRMLGLQELESIPGPVEPLEYEFMVHPTIEDMAGGEIHADLQPENDSWELRDSLWFLRGTGIYNSVDSSTPSVLATELLPAVRAIARHDKWKEEKSNRLYEEHGVVTRRSKKSVHKAMGLDENTLKRYFEEGDLDEILETAPESCNETCNLGP